MVFVLIYYDIMSHFQVLLTLSGLSGGSTYTISIYTVCQAGLRSASAATFTWTVLKAAPTVEVLARPDGVSGTSRPLFRFAAGSVHCHW